MTEEWKAYPENEPMDSGELKLKNCPLCGSAEYVYLTESDQSTPFTDIWMIFCSSCDLTLDASLGKDETIEKWNKRHER